MFNKFSKFAFATVVFFLGSVQLTYAATVDWHYSGFINHRFSMTETPYPTDASFSEISVGDPIDVFIRFDTSPVPRTIVRSGINEVWTVSYLSGQDNWIKMVVGGKEFYSNTGFQVEERHSSMFGLESDTKSFSAKGPRPSGVDLYFSIQEGYLTTDANAGQIKPLAAVEYKNPYTIYRPGQLALYYGTQAGLMSVGDSATSGTLTMQTQVSPVPEPETYAMLLAGLGLITVRLKRRKVKVVTT